MRASVAIDPKELTEELQLVPLRVKQKRATSITLMSEEIGRRIKAYLEYYAKCNYGYEKVMSHLVKKFSIDSFRCPQPPLFWKASMDVDPSNTIRPTQDIPSI
ncbi:hypothetical protein PVK06_011303 [Gossypium arboreum]|uniref:Uncharacterized protein n=1 Tax=Gossypium arboreum TaxID=29729 RepID=A0ABR0Q8Y5_GOSAR|nr:hypothetical protein PVK06_011303 [Gossypium arboreum]